MMPLRQSVFQISSQLSEKVFDRLVFGENLVFENGNIAKPDRLLPAKETHRAQCAKAGLERSHRFINRLDGSVHRFQPQRLFRFRAKRIDRFAGMMTHQIFVSSVYQFYGHNKVPFAF